jgi:Zn-dependent protease/predicted transcriptional regulator
MNAAPGPGHLLIARLFGIPIYLHFSWMVIFGLIVWTLATGYFPAHYPDLPASSYWAKGLVASLLFFVSILLHELGHALVGRARGLRTRSIVLFIFGGVAQLEKDPEDGRTELWMAAAGPIVSLALALLFHLAASGGGLGPSGSAVARYLALINLALALFNLVPAFPLDGGRILRGLLWKPAGKQRATRIAAGAGTFFAFFLIAAGVLSLLAGQSISGIWYILLGWFLMDASAGAYKRVRLDDTLGGLTVRDAMLREVATLPAHISLEEAAHEHFLHTGYGGYPVVRGDTVVGLLCLRDILRRPPGERTSTSVQSAMAPLEDGIVISPEAPLLAAMVKMAEAGTGRLLAMENGRLVGLLTMNAIVRHVRVREELRA